MASVVVEMAQGAVRGSSVGGALVFKGIPYGSSPGGPGRFRAASPASPWSGVVDAIEFGPACPQPAFGLGGELDRLMPVSGADVQDENCLTLNVWTPDLDGPGRPVMVWAHGGAYTVGSGADPVYDGTNLAVRGDVVVVTVNHRLGALGYLFLGELLGADYAGSGNVGNEDLVLALEWIRDNIAAFGGDPDRVTIFGVSGGGLKVSCLLAMPSAQGLFQRAIVQSGPQLKALEPEAATATAVAVLAELGLTPAEAKRLLDVPVDQLTAAQTRALGGQLGLGIGGRALGPVVDGDALPRHPGDPDGTLGSAGVPILIGSNKDEMTLFLSSVPAIAALDDEPGAIRMLRPIPAEQAADLLSLYRTTRPDDTLGQRVMAIMGDRVFRMGSIRLAERRAAQEGASVWMYRFDYETDVLDGSLRCPHGLDVPSMFDNVDAWPITGTKGDRHALAARMSDTWAAFARQGDPNNPGLPPWPAYQVDERATMLLDTEPVLALDPAADERRAYDGVPVGLF